MEIRDVDSYTTQKELEVALDQDLLDQDLRELKGDSEGMATEEMDKQGGDILLETAYMKIHWINWIVRRRILAARCFK